MNVQKGVSRINWFILLTPFLPPKNGTFKNPLKTQCVEHRGRKKNELAKGGEQDKLVYPAHPFPASKKKTAPSKTL